MKKAYLFLIFLIVVSCNKNSSNVPKGKGSLQVKINGQQFDYSLDAFALKMDEEYLHLYGYKTEQSGQKTQLYLRIRDNNKLIPNTYLQSGNTFPMIFVTREIESAPGVITRAFMYSNAVNPIKITLIEINDQRVKGNFEGDLMRMDPSGNATGTWESLSAGTFELSF